MTVCKFVLIKTAEGDLTNCAIYILLCRCRSHADLCAHAAQRRLAWRRKCTTLHYTLFAPVRFALYRPCSFTSHNTSLRSICLSCCFFVHIHSYVAFAFSFYSCCLSQGFQSLIFPEGNIVVTF